MGYKCPKCGYERKPEDLAPEHECPSCGVVYAKYEEGGNKHLAKAETLFQEGKVNEAANYFERISQRYPDLKPKCDEYLKEIEKYNKERDLVSCQKCDKKISKHAQICRHCGAPNHMDTPETEDTFENISSQKNTKIIDCPDCHKEINEDSIFCSYCNAPIRCPKCGKKINIDADSCFNCNSQKIDLHTLFKGEKIEYSSPISGGVALVYAVAVVVMLIMFYNFHLYWDSRETTTETSQEQTREERIQKGFSRWDGSHRALTREIKNSMHDPSSYQHVETVFRDDGEHLIVRTTYRGKNVFGGVVTNRVTAKVDLNGNVIDIINRTP